MEKSLHILLVLLIAVAGCSNAISYYESDSEVDASSLSYSSSSTDSESEYYDSDEARPRVFAIIKDESSSFSSASSEESASRRNVGM
jgi:hypothetical protein